MDYARTHRLFNMLNDFVFFVTYKSFNFIPTHFSPPII